ncbi:MAG: acetate--CoA ligase family protein, partial [Chloroflexota bacterium]|nr:acetate--CoA ligase family protein [Chloroflexota bacterium]
MSTATEYRRTAQRDQGAVREVLDGVRSEGRTSLSAPEAKRVCDAYGIEVPREGLATSAEEAVALAEDIGYPVVLKIVSPDILHKTEAKGVLVGVASADDVASGYETIVRNAQAYNADASVTGVQVQQMLSEGEEVLIGAVTDPTFGPVVTFGIGGVLVEVLRDVTFRLAPTSGEDALEMVNGIRAADVLRGVRGRPGVDQQALAAMIQAVSELVTDFPEITEVDLNPVLAREDGATAVDARFVASFDAADDKPPRYSQEEILRVMTRLMRPRGIAVIGASETQGKIGNSVMRNLVDGGFEGEIYPINPRASEILGKKCYADVTELPDDVDVAVFAIPAKFVPDTLAKVGDKGIAAAVLIPSGFAETGETELQRQLVESAREHGVRFIGPNIYGVYYTPQHMSAAFTTPYDVQGPVALASQSGGIGMGILGFSRSTKLGVSAIVGLGNKADIDEDDLLTFFEQDDNTQV